MGSDGPRILGWEAQEVWVLSGPAMVSRGSSGAIVVSREVWVLDAVQRRIAVLVQILVKRELAQYRMAVCEDYQGLSSRRLRNWPRSVGSSARGQARKHEMEMGS